MTLLQCPNCRGTKWKQIQRQEFTGDCTIDVTENGPEIEVSPRSEHVRDMETAVTVAYMCANDDCPFVIAADKLEDAIRPQGGQAWCGTPKLMDFIARRENEERENLTGDPVHHGPYEEPVQREGESDDEFSQRKSFEQRDQLQARKNAEQAATETEDPVTKMKRVYGG